MPAEKTFLIEMPVQKYSSATKPHAPERFFEGEAYRVVGFDGTGRYVLDRKGWIEGFRRVVVLKGDGSVTECSAAEARPQMGDVIIASPAAEIHRIRADQRQNGGSFTTTDNTFYREFPQNGVLLRNGGTIVLGEDIYKSVIGKSAEEILQEAERALRAPAA